MSNQSFADLGVSTPVRNALAKRGITEPFASPEARDRRRSRRPRRPRQVPHRVGQDACLLGSDRRAASAGEAPPGSALVVAPTRELALQICEDLRPIATVRNLSVATVYGGAGIAQAGEARPPRADPGGHAGTPARPHGARRRLAQERPDPRPRRGGPHARHGLPPRRRAHHRRDSERPPDDAVLGDARRRGQPHRQEVHATRPCATSTSLRAEQRPGRASLRRRHPREALRRARRRAPRRPRAGARSSSAPSAAPTGSSRGSARTAIKAVAMHGNKSQNQRERALAAVRLGQGRRAGRDRRRRPRHRRRRHQPRDQLRSARATATPTSTASGAPPARAAAASGSPSSATRRRATSARSPRRSSSGASSPRPATRCRRATGAQRVVEPVVQSRTQAPLAELRAHNPEVAGSNPAERMSARDARLARRSRVAWSP